jgi:hypothetical protein
MYVLVRTSCILHRVTHGLGATDSIVNGRHTVKVALYARVFGSNNQRTQIVRVMLRRDVWVTYLPFLIARCSTFFH